MAFSVARHPRRSPSTVPSVPLSLTPSPTTRWRSNSGSTPRGGAAEATAEALVLRSPGTSRPAPTPTSTAKPPTTKPSENIQVVCRFRPARETDPFQWHTASQEQGCVQITIPERRLAFGFDKVFDGAATQAEVYESVRHVVTGIMEGFNGTLLAYGQTSSGKTHTMLGKLDELETGGGGVIPRAVHDLFAMVAECKDTVEFTFKCQHVEIYCEKVRDLLDPENGTNLGFREDPQGGVAVVGATEVFVTCQAELLKLLEVGQTVRATSATRMNEESSRSHALLLLTVTQKNTETLHVRRGKLVLVDLAGSERIAKTGAAGLRLEEAKNINRSLTTLGMVIKALADRQPHIPYRDARLTRLLEESLGGNSKTCLIICCSPELSHSQESISTLRFGERAKCVQNHAVPNEEVSMYELQLLLNKALLEIESLKTELAGVRVPSAATVVIPLETAAPVEGDEAATAAPLAVAEEAQGAAGAEEQSTGEVELLRLRALLGKKDEELALLGMQNEELMGKLAEEEAAVARALEDQQALESRLREAEAGMDTMMRAMVEAGHQHHHGSSSTTTTTHHGNAAAPPPPDETTEQAQSPAKKDGTATCPSPDARQVYEEKLHSVERICTYLQDELDSQREAFENINRSLLTQNAQLAMQKDVHGASFVRRFHVRHPFTLTLILISTPPTFCSPHHLWPGGQGGGARDRPSFGPQSKRQRAVRPGRRRPGVGQHWRRSGLTAPVHVQLPLPYHHGGAEDHRGRLERNAVHHLEEREKE